MIHWRYIQGSAPAHVRSAFRRLKPALPPFVRLRVKPHNAAGEWAPRGRWLRWFDIIIDAEGSEDEQVDAVIHECAHVVANFLDDSENHDAAWGMHYARLYRLIWED